VDTVTIRELAHTPARVFERLRSGPLVVTRNGRPVAALYGLDEEGFLDYVLVNAPEFVRDMARADRDLAEGKRGRSLKDALADIRAEERR
jgi:antitoxin (DNA-binding transcriptional repressor) of toxin-antitoxin stability system